MRIDGRLALLILIAAASALALHALDVPAGWLFGPLAVAAISAVRGWRAVQFPHGVYLAAQATIGTALGSGFRPGTLGILPHHLGIFTFAVFFILLASLLNGWLLARFSKLDPATAFLGTMPGGASVMASMSDSLGADTRLVAAVQYVRLLMIIACLAGAAPLLKMHAHAVSAGAVPAMLAAPAAPFALWKLGVLVLLAATGWLAGMKTRIPAGAFLVPTLLYFLLGMAGLAPGLWPWPILAMAYVIMGMQIGGRFHPSTVALIRNVILPVLGTTLLLLLASFALAWIVMREMGLNFASAYLASTPGGLDSVAAVAAELHIDTTIVVTMHLVRLMVVLLAGPWLARTCTDWFAARRGIG
jgi:membrane AbrB-like protein